MNVRKWYYILYLNGLQKLKVFTFLQNNLTMSDELKVENDTIYVGCRYSYK